jgi:hypothetical protein
MDLTPYVDGIRREVGATAELAGRETAELAGRLVGSIGSAVRLALLDALSAAADEITRELAPGTVELRLRGDQPAFVVTPPPAADEGMPATEPLEAEAEADTARITLRLPESLKARVEAAAARERVSVNTWLVRAVSGAVSGGRGPRRGAFPGQSLQGWAR